jgi:two-component system KDP operon response regulator KdpE
MLSHQKILSEVWGAAHKEDRQFLRVYIGQLREKLRNDSENSQMIMNEPGIGYRMEIIESNLQRSA